MEEQKLCKDCFEWLRLRYGETAYHPPYTHCHHPEPVKVNCKWCEVWQAIKLTWHDTSFWRDISYLINASGEPLGGCPVCGAKI